MNGGHCFLQSTLRTGTTWLRDMLSRNQGLQVLGEVLSPEVDDLVQLDVPIRWYQFLVGELTKDPTNILPRKQRDLFLRYLDMLRQYGMGRVMLIDLKLEQLEEVDCISPVIFVPENRFIVLRRLNVLKQVVSEMIMYKRLKDGDTILHREFTPKRETVIIETPSLLWHVRRRIDITNRYKKKLDDCGAKAFFMTYEDMIGQKSHDVLINLQAFLGVKPINLHSSLAKQNPQHLSELIENYDEVHLAFQATEFAYMLFLPS